MIYQSAALVAALTLSTSVMAMSSKLDQNVSRSICGDTNDLQDVERYDGSLGPTINFVDQYQGPVGQLQWKSNLAQIYTKPGNVSGVRWCSGTLIASNLFLTAGQCFDVAPNDGHGFDFPLNNGTNNEITPQQAALNMQVNMNYQRDHNGNLRAATTFNVTNMIEYRNNGLDYAILQLDGNAGQQFGIQQVSQQIPQRGDLVTIIQHPDGEPKQIEAGEYAGRRAGGFMRYTNLDTRGASRGSGVLNDAGELIGIHTYGGCGLTGGANHGILIDDIMASSDTLSNLRAPVAKNDNFYDWVPACEVRSTFTIRPLTNDSGAAIKIIAVKALTNGSYTTVEKLEFTDNTIKVTGELCEFRLSYTISNDWGQDTATIYAEIDSD